MNIHWKDSCWSWNSNTLATWCKGLIHWERPWCWQRLKGGEGDDRGWDGWMASPTQWTWVWVNSGSWWWTGRPGVLQSMGSQTVGHDWVTELCVCVCVCVYIYICTHIHECIYLYTWMHYLYTWMYIYIYTCIQVNRWFYKHRENKFNYMGLPDEEINQGRQSVKEKRQI